MTSRDAFAELGPDDRARVDRALAELEALLGRGPGPGPAEPFTSRPVPAPAGPARSRAWADAHPQRHARCHRCWNLAPVCSCDGPRARRVVGGIGYDETRIPETGGRYDPRRVWRIGVDHAIGGPLPAWWVAPAGPSLDPDPVCEYDPVLEATRALYLDDGPGTG